MKAYEASAEIDASPETIWAILVDGVNYPAWESGVVSVNGRIGPDAEIAVVSSANPGRAFPVKVTEFNPGTSMTWTGGLPLGLFKGVRTFRLTPTAEGSTRFDLREEYSGLLLGFMSRSIPDLGPSFEQFARGLKARAERTA